MDRVPISGSRELQIKKKKRSPNAPNYEVKNTQISSAPPKTSFDTKVNFLAIPRGRDVTAPIFDQF